VWWSILVALAQIVICLLALGVLPRDKKPSTAMAWLILVIGVPFLGILLYLLFGRTSVGRHRREWQQEVNEQVLAAVAAGAAESPAELAVVPAASRAGQTGIEHLNERLGALPMRPGCSVEIGDDYAGCFEAMRVDVERAERFVHVEFYISAWDEMTDALFTALEAAAERGVEVRLLFDHLGSRGIPVYKEMLAKLRATSIEWHPMLPVAPLRGQVRRPDLRNHRKILVVDASVGFAGSQNLIEPCYNKPKNQKAGREWVELMARVEGPVVAALNAVFMTDWYTETDEVLTDTITVPGTSTDGTTAQVVPSGPGFVTENNLRMFTTLLYSAQRRISITSPYFVPDESLLYAVTTAAQRGIDVELFVSAVGDQFMVYHAQRSYYEALLDAGVRIYLYPAPYVLHAKHFTVDDDVAVIGSSNMDLRSFALNYEVSVMLLGPSIVASMRAVQDTYRSLSRELTVEEWRGRSRRSRYVDNVMRLTSALQ
jgi:cardiolipin synthase A/B